MPRRSLKRCFIITMWPDFKGIETNPNLAGHLNPHHYNVTRF